MIPYSLHVALLIMISLLFYKLMLKKETYHTLNRVVLLACLAVAFILPFVPVPRQFSLINENILTASVTKPAAYPETSTATAATPTPLPQQTAAPVANNIPEATAANFNRESMLKWALWIYWGGVIIFGVNLLIQLVVLCYKIFKSEVIHDGSYRIVELDDDKAPCSFGNYIFINPAKYDWDTYNQILIHEKVHVQQYHTVDLIIAEVMVVFQWFNPLAWLYRKEIENNLEFLTDHTVIDRYDVKQDEYQLNLLKVSVPNYAMTITTNYNQSLLKQRMMMMNARRSNVHIVWKYFAIIPLFICMICLLNKPVAVSAQVAQKLPADTLRKKSKVIQNNKLIVQKNKLVKKAGTLVSKNALGAKNGLTYRINDNVALSNVITDKPVVIDRAVVANKANLTQINADDKHFTADDLIKLQANGVSAVYAKSVAYYNKNYTANDIIAFQANGVTLEYLQLINALRYDNFTASNIIDLQHHGVGVDYLEGAGAKYRNFTSNDIINLKENGVTAGYILGVANAGYRNFIAKDIINLKKNGVSTSYIKGISEAGYINFTANDIIALQESGVSTSYVKGIGVAGYKVLTANDIIKLHKNGVTAGYVQGVSNK
ncbi:hypothetical protein GCM10027049_29090 [Mucilaginibacter puniceus]